MSLISYTCVLDLLGRRGKLELNSIELQQGKRTNEDRIRTQLQVYKIYIPSNHIEYLVVII